MYYMQIVGKLTSDFKDNKSLKLQKTDERKVFLNFFGLFTKGTGSGGRSSQIRTNPDLKGQKNLRVLQVRKTRKKVWYLYFGLGIIWDAGAGSSRNRGKNDNILYIRYLNVLSGELEAKKILMIVSTMIQHFGYQKCRQYFTCSNF